MIKIENSNTVLVPNALKGKIEVEIEAMKQSGIIELVLFSGMG